VKTYIEAVFFLKADFRKTESITGPVFNDFFMEL
jgi:hypothetical protein